MADRHQHVAQLQAQQHEHQAVEEVGDHPPHLAGVAPPVHRQARDFLAAGPQPCDHDGQDAGHMQGLGGQIGGIGNEDRQQCLQHRIVDADDDQVLAQPPPEPLDDDAHDHAAARQQDELCDHLGGRDMCAAAAAATASLKLDQPGGVVEQALGIDDVRDTVRQRQPGGGGHGGHRVGRCDDCAEHEGHRQRHRRHQPVDEIADHHHREHHQPQRQQQHGAQHVQQVASRQQPCIGEQQWRNEQQQEHVRIDIDVVEPGQPRRGGADDDQEDRQADARPAHQGTADGGDQQQNEGQLDDGHGITASWPRAAGQRNGSARTSSSSSPGSFGSRGLPGWMIATWQLSAASTNWR